MSEPMVWCKTCGRKRDHYLHVRSQRVPPPKAALHWLIKTCSLKDPVGEKPCDLHYQAGFTAPQGMT